MQQRTPEEYKAAYQRHKQAGNTDKAARVAQLYRDHLSNQTQVASEDRDSAFEYSIDQAQKMYGGAVQDVGRIVGSPSVEKYGKQVSDKQDKDIEKGGYQSQYSTARDSFAKEGLPGVFKWAAEGVQENAVSGGASLVGAAGTAAAAYLGAPVWAVGALGTLTLGNSIALNTGDSVLEQQEKTGDFDARVATGVGVIAGILDRIGAGRAIPKPDLAKMTTEEVIGELMKQGKKKAAVEFAKRIGAEGVTETAQEALNMGGTALVGGQYTSEEVADRLTDSFLLGSAQSGVMNTGIKAVQGTANIASKFSPKSGASAAKMVRTNSDNIRTSDDMEAAASLAQRLASISDANEYDLEDIEKMSTTGARETVDKAHVQYTEELKQLFKDLKDRVKVNDQDSLQEIVDKILAEAAYREGRNKTKNTVGRQEMDALERLAGDTFEGQQAVNILKQLNQLTQIHNNGYQGGVSQITDQFSPLGSSVGYDRGAVATERLLRPIVSGSAALSTGGTSLLGQLAAQGTGRMIDKATGNRSKVRKYVQENQGGQPLAPPNAPSLRMQKIAEAQAAQEAEIAAQAAAEQRAAEEQEANLARVQAGAPPLMGSPEDVFRDGTGLDRSGLAQVIRILKSNPNTRAATRRAIEAYETSIATGGRVDFSLIRDINALVDQNPQLQQLQVRPRNQGAATQAVQQQLSQQDANYQRGMENNKAFAQQLQDALAQDKSVLPIHKAHLGEALNQMQLDLGAAPVKRLKAIEDRLAEKGVPTEAAAKYFGPYVERVVAQQEAKADRDATAAALDEDPINDARIVPVPRGNDRMQQIFGVNEPGEGGNYIDLDSKQDLTGNTYTGGVVKIIDGKPLLETNDAPAAPATKESGNKVKVNLFKQKAGWKWIDYDGPETIVSTHQGSKHHYSLSSDFETPVTLQTYPKQPSEPRLRPTSQGKVVLGNKIGSISVRGKVHPVYDEVKVVDKRDQADPVNDSKGITLAAKVKILREQYEENPNSKEARRAYLDARDERDASGDFGEEVTTDYRVQHQAPVSDDDAPMHLLDRAMPDFYTSPRYYKTGSKLDSKTLDILQQLKGKPEQIVKVYRAVPKDAPDTINYGDWVTVNKQYAEDHGEGMPEGYKIIEGSAPAKNIKTNGDSIHEFGYAQFDPGKTESDKIVDSRLPALTVSSSPNVISLMDGSETAPKLTGKTEVATFLQERALEKLGGQPRDLASEADRDAIADDMVSEAVHEMENQDDAMEWYDSTIAKTLSMMSMKHPELDTDPDAKTAFLISLAITSQNLAVPENLKYGEEVYQHFSQNGRFLEKKFGSKGGAVKLNLEKANMLLDRLGSMEELRSFLESKFTVRELDKILKQHLDTDSKQVSGENVDTEVYGAQVFGPKIGNGFYTNLRGDFSPVTIDMWFMRTVGRLQGKVLSFDEKRFNNQLQRLKTALGKKRMSKDALIAKAQQLKSKHESDFKKFRSEYDSGKRKKSDATKAAEQIVISLKGTRDVPANGTERNQLRDIVNRAVVKFKDQTGIDIPPASFQALIWYPEQDLYKSLGVNLKSTRQDYASSTKRFLIQEGYNEEDLNRAADRVRSSSQQGAGSAQPGTSQANQETVGAAGGRTGRPLQEEKGPVLATEDPVNNSVEAAFARVQRDYLEPTPAEIKEKLPEAKDVIEFTIGKKGTAFEDGVRSEEDIRRLAALLDISIRVANTLEAANKVMSKDSRGNYAGQALGTMGVVNVRGPELMGKPQFIATLTHEVGHGVESQTLNRDYADYSYDKSPHPQGSKASDAVHLRHGSYREHMHHVLKIAKGEDVDRSDLVLPDYDDAVRIREEIDHIQKAVVSLRFTGFAPGSIDTEALVVRESIEDLINDEAEATAERVTRMGSSRSYEDIYKDAKANMMRDYGRPHIRYLKDTAEYANDSVVLYLADPQMMKLLAPTTAAYMQKVFKHSNMPVKFYSSPLVAIMAILLAGLAKGMGGEEEEQQPGALSMQPGPLTT